MVSALDVGPFRLRVYDAAGGPAVVSDEPRLEPLTMLLNHARPGDSFSEAVRTRGHASSHALEVRAQTDGDEADESTARVWSLGTEDPVLVRWVDLQLALERLQGLREHWSPPSGPWLFTSHPTSPLPSPEDLEIVRRLAREAEDIDAADATAEVGAEPAELLERRRRFLAECDAAGVFDPHPFVSDSQDARTAALRNYGSRSLLDLREAALALRSWGLLGVDGPDTAGSRSVLSGPVCLDYVRLALWPPGEDGPTWARRATGILSPPEDAEGSLQGQQGLVLRHVAEDWVRVYWRRDGALPAVLAVALGTG